MEAKVRAWDPFRGLKQPLIEKKENEEEEDGAKIWTLEYADTTQYEHLMMKRFTFAQKEAEKEQ